MPRQKTAQPILAIFPLLSMLLVFCLNSVAVAQSKESELDTSTIASSLDRIEAGMQREFALQQNLEDYLDKLPRYSGWAKKCVDTASVEIESIEGELGKLGGATLDEPLDSKAFRAALLDKKSLLSNDQRRCKTLLVRTELASRELSRQRKQLLEERSFTRGPNIIEAFHALLSETRLWVSELGTVLASRQGIQVLQKSEKITLALITLTALLVGMLIRGFLRRWLEKRVVTGTEQLNKLDSGTRVITALAMTLKRYLTPIITSLSAGLYIHAKTLDVAPKPLITIIMDDLPLLLVIFAVTYLVFEALRSLGLAKSLQNNVAHSMHKRLNVLALIWFIAYLLTQTILANSLPDEVLFLDRAILGTFFVVNLLWILWRTPDSIGNRFKKPVRLVTTVALVATLIAEYAGYRNLSGAAFSGVIGSLLAYWIFNLAYDLFSQFLRDLDQGKSTWQKKFRRMIGVKDGDKLPGFLWVKLIAATLVWSGFILTLLWVWGVPDADIQAVAYKLSHGFQIGSVEIIPLKIFEAVIVLILLLTLNSWALRVFDNNLLGDTKIDRGARESVRTIGNYAGIGITIVVALSVAGVDFSKLALIAGALSVGIGFGLKDIINNFVSGLILLFERPIKTGDWVIANGVEGRIKKISIRSTEIESFDRADIIVPNSLVISDNLTNWVHKSRIGRIRIPVSVAYGSDTELVKTLLIDMARANSSVILGNQQLHDPRVLFLAFGESSLDFELRFFVVDIENRLYILSDFNFAIDKAFRDHNIEIPFPQRDIHIRQTPATPIDIERQGVPSTDEPPD